MFHLDEIISAQKHGENKGIVSICSSHPAVLTAAFSQALSHGSILLVESTCNQVNQFGGYSSMTPFDFVQYLHQMADQHGFPRQDLILGGDHLGPEIWQAEPAGSAMGKARVLIADYVRAGYCKIHFDASMKLGDDPEGLLHTAVSSSRAADLASVAEAAYRERVTGEAPRYVIGTEVPVPGGALESDTDLQVTRVADAEETIRATQQAFYDRGLESAWGRVIALVVQPGVEFGHDFIHGYDPGTAAALSDFITNQNMVYEAHSTDYQSAAALHQLVEDHFAILKVGPALTYAYRDAVFALSMMESVLIPETQRSNLIETLDQVMVSDPTHWQKYYQGDLNQQRFARLYSLSDRCRYYWTHPNLQIAIKRLFSNLRGYQLPLSLISQYLPAQYTHIRMGQLTVDPEAMVIDKIKDMLDVYWKATGNWCNDQP